MRVKDFFFHFICICLCGVEVLRDHVLHHSRLDILERETRKLHVLIEVIGLNNLVGKADDNVIIVHVLEVIAMDLRHDVVYVSVQAIFRHREPQELIRLFQDYFLKVLPVIHYHF